LTLIETLFNITVVRGVKTMKKGKKAVTLSLASLLAFSVFTTSVSASVSSSDVDRIPETVSVTESEVGTVEPQNLPAVARGLAKAGKEAWNWYKKYQEGTTPYLGSDQNLSDTSIHDEVTEDLEVIFD